MKRLRTPSFFGARTPILLFLGALVAVTLYRTVSTYIIGRRTAEEKERLEEAVSEKEAAITQLRAKIEKIESGGGLEIEAKRRLNLQKPDEKVLVIVDDRGATTSENGEGKGGFWKKLKGWFGF